MCLDRERQHFFKVFLFPRARFQFGYSLYGCAWISSERTRCARQLFIGFLNKFPSGERSRFMHTKLAFQGEVRKPLSWQEVAQVAKEVQATIEALEGRTFSGLGQAQKAVRARAGHARDGNADI